MNTTAAFTKTFPLIRMQTGDADLHIASLVLHIKPEFQEAVADFIASQTFCTSYTDANEHKTSMVVVLEVSSQADINDFINTLQGLQGIVTVNLVYHHCEPVNLMNKEFQP